MVPGFGALPKVPPKYNPANDNVEGGRTLHVTRISFPDAPSIDLPPTLPAAIEISGAFKPAPDSPTVEEFVKATGLRVGGWLQTFSGQHFYSMDPRTDEVHIEDIAHSLSLQCRFAGHCIRFYSVAEHSVLLAWWLYRHAGPQTALACLLHDASEAYLVDVPRPVKPFLAGYKEAESKVQAAIMERFGLPAEMPRAVKEADDWIIGDELANMKPMAWHARYARTKLGVTLQYWEPSEAEAKFLAAFEALSAEVRGMASV